MYKIVIFDEKHDKILSEENKKLLEISPEKFHYADALEINNQLKRKYGIDTNVLCCLNHKRSRVKAEGIYVVELKTDLGSENLKFFDKEEVLTLQEEFDIKSYLDNKTKRPRWQMLGYSSWLKDWLSENMDIEISDFYQIKNNALSAVYKVIGDNSNYYVKILPRIFSSELNIIKYLANKYPKNIPDVYLTNAQENILITKEINGNMLYEFDELDVWKDCLTTYAKIQLSERDQKDKLLELGFKDRTMNNLREQLEVILKNISSIGINKDYSLTKDEIQFFRDNIGKFKELTYELELSDVPYTIDHGDFYVANIAIEDDRCVIFDWSDGCISHPFLSMIPFFSECEFSSDKKDKLLAHYLNQFSDFGTIDELLKEYSCVKVVGEMHLAWTYYEITNSLAKDLQWEMEKSFISCIRGIIKYFKKEN